MIPPWAPIAILGIFCVAGLTAFVATEFEHHKLWKSKAHKSCWKCAHRQSPGFERFSCAKKMVWTVGFFNGVKNYDMGALAVRDYYCRKFKRMPPRPSGEGRRQCDSFEREDCFR